MSHELYKKYRPKTFKAFAGNKAVKNQLAGWVRNKKVPHCILFQGGSGMGKTTLARILRTKLNCGDADLREINAAGKARGIDEVKKIESQISMAPISGDCRFYIIDEAHKMTNDAQNAILKMLEDTPKHVYFVLCTTEPNKLLKTIKTRSTIVTVSPLTQTECEALLVKICKREKLEVEEEVVEAIAKASDGSSRKALVLLNQVADMDPEQRLDAIVNTDETKHAIDLCRLLMNTRTKWPAVAKLIKSIEGLEAESFRWMMLSYANNVILGGGKNAARAFVILDQFSSNYYDTKKSGLLADCWEVIHGEQ